MATHTMSWGLVVLAIAVTAPAANREPPPSMPASVQPIREAAARPANDESSPPAAAARSRDLAAILEKIREDYGLPALGGAVVRHGELSAIAVTGKRNMNADASVTIDDQWHIGSDGKAMTATLIGVLIDQGKLRWSTTLAEVFPELGGVMDPAYRGVTIEQLLWHRAGFPAGLNEGGLWNKLLKREGTPTEQRRVLLEGVLTRPPAAPPGTKFIYSNAGYAVAGAVAEKVTGQSWEELMRTLLFEPLGMKSAGFGAPGSARVSVTPASSAAASTADSPGSDAGGNETDQPWGHIGGPHGKFTPVPPGPLADNPPAIAPAGTVHCSLADWAKFVALHLRGARDELTPEQSALIKAQTIRRLQTPPAGQQAPDGAEYACGWLVLQRAWGGRVLTHTGSNTMWLAVVWLAPEKDFAVLITTNAGGPGAEKACDDAASRLVKHVISGG